MWHLGSALGLYSLLKGQKNDGRGEVSTEFWTGGKVHKAGAATKMPYVLVPFGDIVEFMEYFLCN